jgi:hypothetical protein
MVGVAPTTGAKSSPGRLVVPVRCLELGRRQPAQRAVEALLVVELHPLGRGELELVGVMPRSEALRALGLVRGVDALGQSIVEALTG